MYDSSGAAASNSGTITATGAARGKDPVYSAGVVLAGKDGIFYNLAGGVVRAQNDFGAGVNVFNSGGNLVQNHGSIISDNFYGVDLGSVALGETGNRLVNRGEITGGNGTSYNGSQNADHILNRGDLNGDVVMGNGDDTIDNRAGTITGDWYGGEGDDYFLGHLGATVTGTIYGGGGSDTLLGGDNADLISGDEGRDLIQGGGGDDLIYGGAGGDTLAGQDGRDYVSGGEGADLMSGGAGNDALSGGEGRDTIYGGDGDDVIQGGTGGDLLYGGAGADTFYFSDASESPVDVAGRAWIMDFKAGEDFINLSAIDADTLTDGRQVFTFIGNTAFSGTAGELRYDRATWLVTGDTDGDGLADFSIVLAHGPTGITATDFILG
ncbi:calcium-binding protein [Paracoccus sp. IB05]|uniref:calcium-binding protein n=1 Tax=Paracoccus sp. IB05 TaxID=2779367 RepID=UPI0018E86785